MGGDRKSLPGIGEQVDQEPVNCGSKISSNSISTNSYDIKIVYHDWDRAVKRSDNIFGSVLRYKRHELDSCGTDYPAWLLWRLFQWRVMVGFSYPGQPSSKSSWTTGLYLCFDSYVRFLSEHEKYKWMNDTVFFGKGRANAFSGWYLWNLLLLL